MIYLDHAATTAVKPEVLDEMLPYFTERYGNASTIYSLGREARKGLDAARARVAAAINASPDEIIFTGSGTEADNQALNCALALEKKGKHIITSAIEHHAVLHAADGLKKRGFKVTLLPVDEYGLVSPEALEKAMTDETALVSIMMANNEVGTIEPIAELAKVAKARGAAFHTDAVQAVGSIPVDVKALGVDMLSLSAHKFYGPKGVGALYVRKGFRVAPFVLGGAQEKNKRAGTENIAGIVGLGKAIELATGDLEARSQRILSMREALIESVMTQFPGSTLNGHRTKRLPGNVNISFPYVESESLLIHLDFEGIMASSGSACTSGSLEPSHVLMAMGATHEQAQGSLRMTLGDENVDDDIVKTIGVLGPIYEKLKAMSPLYQKGGKTLV